jgi:hypothetical protein
VSLNRDGIQYAQSAGMMELLGRLGTALGISLVLTLLLLVLYQDDGPQLQQQPASIEVTQTHAAAATANGTP